MFVHLHRVLFFPGEGVEDVGWILFCDVHAALCWRDWRHIYTDRQSHCVLLTRWHCTSLRYEQVSRRIIRPHRSTTYVDAAYCYRLSIVVCRSLTLVSPAKAEVIEQQFGLRTWVGPKNHMLHGGQISPWVGAILGDRGAHCKV